jgi:hypothetical protein
MCWRSAHAPNPCLETVRPATSGTRPPSTDKLALGRDAPLLLSCASVSMSLQNHRATARLRGAIGDRASQPRWRPLSSKRPTLHTPRFPRDPADSSPMRRSCRRLMSVEPHGCYLWRHPPIDTRHVPTFPTTTLDADRYPEHPAASNRRRPRTDPVQIAVVEQHQVDVRPASPRRHEPRRHVIDERQPLRRPHRRASNAD